MRYWIEAVSGSRAGSRIPIENGQSVTFGRTQAKEIFSDDSAMSGLHFEIRSDGEKIALKNHSQTNGTWVNGGRADIVVLQPGDTIRAGETHFVVAGVSEHDAEGVRIQSWSFGEPPQGWETVPEQGFRYVRDEANVTTVMVSEDQLPERHNLSQYLDIQLTLISQRLPEAEASTTPASVPGAEVSGGLAVRTPFSDGRVVVQKQIYATMAAKVGIVTATAMENEPAEVHQAIDQILKTAIFRSA